MREIAQAVATVTDETKNAVYKSLVTSVKSSMTDQGPTMPQFSEKVAIIREELLRNVVEDWDNMPAAVKETMKSFGTFFCKMHPFINFAEEVNKALKLYEDI